MFFILIFFAIVPMIVYPMFIYWMDRYEKEPLPLMVATFLWGFVPAAILSIIAQLILGIPFYLVGDAVFAEAAGAIILAPLTEEIFKGLAVLIIFLLWKREFDGIFDGIIYGSLVGFGFAAVENILYFLAYTEGDVGTVIIRAFVFGLNHAFFTSLTGIGFGIARHSPKAFTRFAAPLIGLAAAMTAHFIHNAGATFGGESLLALCGIFIVDWMGILMVFVIMLLAIRREREWIKTQLQSEISQPHLSQSTYDTVSSPTRRVSTRLSTLTTHGIGRWQQVGRYFHILTKLAYLKHARSRRAEQGASEAQINDLRQKATELANALSGVL